MTFVRNVYYKIYMQDYDHNTGVKTLRAGWLEADPV